MATPEQTNAITRSVNHIVTDDLRNTTIANLMDSINAAWNGWEAACKFEDEGMQDYYMKYVNVLSDSLKKIRNI